MGKNKVEKGPPSGAAASPPAVTHEDATAVPPASAEAAEKTAPEITMKANEAPDLERASIHVSEAAQAAVQVEDAAPGVNRFTLMAAVLALSAALGATVGALAGYGFSLASPAPALAAAKPGLDEIHALKENVVQARVELAVLKATVDAGNRTASAQFTRVGERIERLERMQAEPAVKLSKAIDMLDRLARDVAAAPKDVTGSVAPQPGAGGQPEKPIDRWVIRDVRRGTALIEGRMGLIEVDPGDVVPGLGRVAAIRKQDGRWVVITSKGLITSAR